MTIVRHQVRTGKLGISGTANATKLPISVIVHSATASGNLGVRTLSVSASKVDVAQGPSWSGLPGTLSTQVTQSVNIAVYCPAATSFDMASGSAALPAGTTLSTNGVLTTTSATPLATTTGLIVRATNANGSTNSPTFSLTTTLYLAWNSIPSVRFDPGVANQSFDLAPYVVAIGGTPQLFYSIASGSETGISLQGSRLIYDPAVQSGSGTFIFNVDDQTPANVIADAATFAINDSLLDGATATQSHPLARLIWKNTNVVYPQNGISGQSILTGTGYGDCVDKNGTYFAPLSGNQPFATIGISGSDAPRSVAIPLLVNYWIAGHVNWGITLVASSSGGIAQFATRTDATLANRPRLTITKSDGTTTIVECSANRYLSGTTFGGTGFQIDATSGAYKAAALLFFDLTNVSGLTAPVQNAVLSMYGHNLGTTTTLEIYATDLSWGLRSQTPVQGLAAASVKDASLFSAYQTDLALAGGASPPSRPSGGVLYAENWPDTNSVSDLLSNPTVSSRGYYGTVWSNLSKQVGASDPDDPSYVPLATGVNAVKLVWRAGINGVCNFQVPFYGPWGYAPEDIWIRFYMRWGSDWPPADIFSTDIVNFKFPVMPATRFTGSTYSISPLGKRLNPRVPLSWSTSGYFLPGGNGGDAASGFRGWSMRNYSQAAGSSLFTRTGTISVTNGSTSVVGNGTTFTQAVGNWFFVSTGFPSSGQDDLGYGYRATVIDDTHLTLNSAYRGVTNPSVNSWGLGGQDFKVDTWGPLVTQSQHWSAFNADTYTPDQNYYFGPDNSWYSQHILPGFFKKNTWHCVESHVKMNTLYTGSGTAPNPVFLGNSLSRDGSWLMQYRSASDPIQSPDTSITTFNKYLYFGNHSGRLYLTAADALHDGDTQILRSDTVYGTNSMIGNKDGLYEVYVDGVLVHQRTDFRYRHCPELTADCLWFDFSQTQELSGKDANVYLAQLICVDGAIVQGPIGPMRTS